MRARLGLQIGLVLVAAAVPAAALAANTATLAISPPATAAFSVTLNGIDQLGSYAVPIPVSYTSANKNLYAVNGWRITATSTVFRGTASGRTLATTASTLTVTDSANCIPKGCSDPTNNIGYPLTLPADTVAPSAITIFNATPGTGVGSNTETLLVSVSIPANTYADTYTSTLTLAAVEGP